MILHQALNNLKSLVKSTTLVLPWFSKSCHQFYVLMQGNCTNHPILMNYDFCITLGLCFISKNGACRLSDKLKEIKCNPFNGEDERKKRVDGHYNEGKKFAVWLVTSAFKFGVCVVCVFLY